MRSLLLVGGVAASLKTAYAMSFPDCVAGPLANTSVCNPLLDPLTRAQSLISLLTLDEKLNNTGSTSPGVPRLGLPAYQWWQEALHGIASSPGVTFAPSGPYSYATSFPQPILMSAAFDDALITAVATVVSTEARAFSNAGRAGLDFWTPNINPFRDPRWGRGQETPGEDAFHLANYVQSLILGLQGPTYEPYKRIVATCKHFIGYDMESWNGNWRYQWDAPVSMQDMAEYFSVPFRSCARDARVGAFMCSYNAVNGVPTCANSWLLNTLLREHWNWTDEQQWITSDCDAIQNVYLPHEWAPTREAAAAAALVAGVDVNCGTYYQNHLPAAYAQGLFNETVLDQALIRQYSSLIRLGYFDPAEIQPYRQLTWTDVDTPAAQQLAYQAAAEGITLLKNDGLLPLDLSGNRTLALIGDWANATTQMQGNYAGIAPYLHSPLYAAQQLTTVFYAQGPGGQGDPTTDAWLPVWSAASEADVIIYVGGIDNSVESEGMDRVSLTWTGAQLDMIGQLAMMGKPMAVAQMGGGQIDSSPIVNNPNISALLWAGYPGQDGGVALFDVITGKVAPAGRLPVTQYPAEYAAQTPMTDMTLRPGPTNPGRTYRWYNGTAVFPFGYGLHYTNFSATLANTESFTAGSNVSISDLIGECDASPTKPAYLDKCPFATVPVDVHNEGDVTSDYVALLFMAGQFGPAPYPLKTLVSYARAFGIPGGATTTVDLPLTLGNLARVDESGNTVLYPGTYTLTLDLQPLLTVSFTLSGEPAVLDEWPQPPMDQIGSGVAEVGPGYFVGGYGSTPPAGYEQETLA